MPSRGGRMKSRRENKKTNRGKARKKKEQNKGTTPKFSVHT